MKEREESIGVDLVEAFRGLAPDCPLISIQRWSLPRLGVTTAVSTGVITIAVLLFNNCAGLDCSNHGPPAWPGLCGEALSAGLALEH